MALRFPAALRTARAQTIVDRAGTGANIRLYTGATPGPDAAIGSQVLLGTLNVGGAFGTISNGVLTVGSITSDASADASGTAGWFRVTSSGGTFVFDGTCGASGSGADLILNSTTVTAGQTISISSFVITEGAA